MELWGGVECTINRVGERFHSQLERSGHSARLEDLDQIHALGIRTLRFPLLWEQLAPVGPAEINWRWADMWMARLRELGIKPIIGLLHHGSGPRYTSLTDARFPEKLAEYAQAVARRYPWVEAYTPVNEPLTTARFSGLYGHWYPHGNDAATFLRALLTQLRGTIFAMRAIREVNPLATLVQTEDMGKAFSTPGLAYMTEFENERRWLTFDLLSGRINQGSIVWKYMIKSGVSPRELHWFSEQNCPPGVLGINHYITSSRYLDENIERYPPEMVGGNQIEAYVDLDAARSRPEGLCEPKLVFEEVWKRYALPMAVTECHLACTREEQMRWFAEIWNAASALHGEGVPMRAVTAWSLLGAYDWASLLTRFEGRYEPGAFDLRSTAPRPTALARLLQATASNGRCEEPMANLPGWWRRPIRNLQESVNAVSAAAPARKTYEPLQKNLRPRMPLIVISGETGVLGQALAKACYLRGLPYRLLSRAEMDIADPESVRSVFGGLKPWALINAAGYVRVDAAEKEKHRCFRENTTGAEILAGCCAELKVRLLTFSSHLVFDGLKAAPYIESDSVTPLNIYGLSKAIAEERIARILPEALIVRTSAFFDPEGSDNFVTRTLESLRAGGPVRAAADVIVSPTYVPDLVHPVLDLFLDGEHGLWHVANKGAVSWAEFARHIARLGGYAPERVRDCFQGELNRSARRPGFTALASQRGEFLAGYEEALERSFFSMRSNCAPV